MIDKMMKPMVHKNIIIDMCDTMILDYHTRFRCHET